MISSLVQTTIEEIHDAFIDAFSDYEVKLDMPIEKLHEMMLTRSYYKKLSRGCFKDGSLAGFLLVGSREIDRKNVFYDVATGVRKKYQGEGVGDQLVKEIPKIMSENNGSRFILEVLENNVPAQSLYKKYGFSVTRKLKCYEYSIDKVKDEKDIKGDSLKGQFPISEISFNDYCTFSPTWQNSYVSYLNMKHCYVVVLDLDGDELLGYGIVHKKNGSILQLGLNPNNRSSRILKRIVEQLIQNTESKVLKYLNIEENSVMETLIKELGFKNTINQYEMEYISK